ncbi:MAG: ABC transporter permease [Acidaminococcaceae bacterium]|jgi:ABC-2 type transport system permease protein|nr:ABC transporter permease [Acidaminococcaceae bacterium]
MILWSLIKKEFYQIVRDSSSIIIAFILPLALLFIYMYGINMDTTKVKLGIIQETDTPAMELLVSGFNKNKYVKVVTYKQRQPAYRDLADSKLHGIVIIPQDFERKLRQGQVGSVQLITDGSESNTANYVYNYVYSIVEAWYLNWSGQKEASLPVTMETTYWYNPEINSHYSILPGSLAITMTLIGILLTGLVVAREWERGTMETLLSAGVSRINLVLGKYIPYYILGMLSLFSNVLVCIFLFKIPFRGSFFNLFVFGSFFLLTCLGVGLFISTKLKSQLLAGQVAFNLGFLPSLLLCGLMFPIQSMPDFFQNLTRIIPASYLVLLLQNEFLVGTAKDLVIDNSLFLLVLSVLLFVLVYFSTPKRLS